MRQTLKLLMTTFMLLLIQIGFAQQRQISGTVQEEDGLPLPGASVVIKGTTSGTSTDMDGKFQLSAKTGDVITISFLGYKSQNLTVDAKSNYTISLKNDDNNLDEIVVVTYGTQKRETVLGSNAVIKAEAIEQRPLTNLTNAIEGSTSGVLVSTGSGQPGSGLSIQIRGTSSYNLSNQPLYVIDGAIYTGSPSDINPDDIETMNILKDAASTSLYGSSAANGVILITTKKGKKGKKGTFNFTNSTGIVSRQIKEYQRVGAKDYYELNWQSLRNTALIPTTANPNPTPASAALAASNGLFAELGNNIYNVPNNQIVIDGKLNPNAQQLVNDLDWQEKIIRKGIRRSYNLNYSGASDNSNYYASFGYNNEEGYVIKSDFERYTARVNADSQVTNWLKLGTNITGTLTKSNLADDSEGSSYVNPFYSTRYMGPIYAPYLFDLNGNLQYDDFGNVLYDDGGTISGRGRGSSAGVGRNVIQETLLNDRLRTTNTINSRFYAEFKLTTGLKFTTNLSYDNQNFASTFYRNKIIGDAQGMGGFSKEVQKTTATTFNQILEYNKSFGNHNFNFIAGHEAFERLIDYQSTYKTNEVIAGIHQLSNFITTMENIGYNRHLTKESYFSRLNYDYDNKYMISGSVRRDQSSRFAPAVDTGVFWSAALGWNIHREEFLANTKINQLKLRASYGQVGNDGGIGTNPGYNADLSLYDLGNYFNNQEGGVYFVSLGNKNLTWEANNQFDVALEYGLFNNRLNGSIEYFNRKTVDMIFPKPLPGSTGITSIFDNVGTMKNEGVEISINGDIISGKNFKWNMGINATTFKNEMVKMPEGQDAIINGTKRLAVGHSLYDFWLRKWYGVDSADGLPLYHQDPEIADGSHTRYINGQRLTTNQNAAEYGYVGTSNPDLYGSISNNFEYKNFYLNTLLTYQIGGKTYDTNYAALMSPRPQGNALHVDMLNAWQEPGDVTNVPLMTTTNTAAITAASSRWLVDSDYISFRQATFGYKFNNDFVKSFGASGLKAYVSAENIYSWTKRAGLEPVQSFNGTTSYRYTPSRIVSFGINVSF